MGGQVGQQFGDGYLRSIGREGVDHRRRGEIEVGVKGYPVVVERYDEIFQTDGQRRFGSPVDFAVSAEGEPLEIEIVEQRSAHVAADS